TFQYSTEDVISHEATPLFKFDVTHLISLGLKIQAISNASAAGHFWSFVALCPWGMGVESDRQTSRGLGCRVAKIGDAHRVRCLCDRESPADWKCTRTVLPSAGVPGQFNRRMGSIP